MNREPGSGAQKGTTRWGPRVWVQVVGTGVGLGLLALLLSREDWGRLQSLLASLHGSVVVTAAGFFALTQVANTGRWLSLVRGAGVRLGFFEAYRLVLAGLFASNFLPSTVGGDVTRIAGILPRSSDRVGGAATVVADRLISLAGMCALIPLSFPILGAWTSGGFAVGFAASRGSSGSTESPVRRFLGRARGVLTLWRRKPGSLIKALGLSWLGVICYLAGMWLLARDLGIEVTPIQVAGATTITYFLTLVPIAINGYGIREAAILAVYLPLGASPEQATALALLSRALVVLVTFPGALWLGGITADSLAPRRGSEGDGP